MTDDVTDLRRRAGAYDDVATDLIATRRELSLAKFELSLARDHGVSLNDAQKKALSFFADRDNDWSAEAMMSHAQSFGWVETGSTVDDLNHVPTVDDDDEDGGPVLTTFRGKGSAARRFLYQ